MKHHKAITIGWIVISIIMIIGMLVFTVLPLLYSI